MDVLRLHLNDLAHCEFLSHDEEKRLFALIVAARKATRLLRAHHALPTTRWLIPNWVCLSAVEWTAQQVATIQAATGPKHRIAESCMRMAFRVGYDRAFKRRKEPDDFVAWAHVGLLDAIEMFRPELGFRFSTYAYWHMQKRILGDAYECDRMIRIPRCRLTTKYRKEHPVDDARLFKYPRSLSSCVGRRRTRTLASIVPDHNTASVCDSVDNADEFEVVAKVISQTIDSRHREILFRMANGDTLKQIGADLSISKERVRQMEKWAIRRIRSYLAARSCATL